MLPNYGFTINKDNGQNDEKFIVLYFFKPPMIDTKITILQRTKLMASFDRIVARMIIFASMAVYLLTRVI